MHGHPALQGSNQKGIGTRVRAPAVAGSLMAGRSLQRACGSGGPEDRWPTRSQGTADPLRQGLHRPAQRAADRRHRCQQQQRCHQQGDHPRGDQAVVAVHAHLMIGMGVGSRLRCRFAVRHRHRMMVVVAVHRMLCVQAVVHRRHRCAGRNVAMRQPAAHQRGEQHQQHGKPCQGLEPAVENRTAHAAILRGLAQPWPTLRVAAQAVRRYDAAPAVQRAAYSEPGGLPHRAFQEHHAHLQAVAGVLQPALRIGDRESLLRIHVTRIGQIGQLQMDVVLHQANQHGELGRHCGDAFGEASVVAVQRHVPCSYALRC
ncbi:hypothetical protein G6F65_013201 [Rhizopus arrhizus]|nr:hypothetical protein G6F65_013201 [Rhizopus arrhizus]